MSIPLLMGTNTAEVPNTIAKITTTMDCLPFLRRNWLTAIILSTMPTDDYILSHMAY